MDSVRSYVGLWFGLTVCILGYAFLDLQHNPWLHEEHNFTMTPDLNQIWDLTHWGGRLLKEGAFGLLICNAILVAGILALVVSSVLRAVRTAASPGRTGTAELAPERMSLPPG
jgi:hypothetical protein